MASKRDKRQVLKALPSSDESGIRLSIVAGKLPKINPSKVGEAVDELEQEGCCYVKRGWWRRSAYGDKVV